METTTPSYEVDLEDERLEEVNDKWAGISSEVTDNYQGMIDQADSFYQDVQDAMDKSVEAQKQNQQALTDFTIEKIEQQKEQAHKDYVKEQSGAYKDWQKQSDQYGVNAEQMAASGMTNTGFSESSRVAMYNTYQNRVATAREVLSQAMLNYDNNIKEAMLQNNSILAQIEADAAIKAAELALEGFQYKNSLILEQTNKKIELENMRSSEWYKMLEQINTESGDDETTYKDEDEDDSEEYPVDTEYYRGNKNPDAEKYGTFKNGYQPKGISGHGKLEKTGDDITFETVTLSGKKKTVTQNIWEAEDYSKWYWDGRENKYKLYMPDKDIVHQTVQTEYYEGLINPDAAIYGTFNNGYQPKGIFGVGKLEKTGFKTTFNTVTLSGEKKTVTQNIWIATDGSHWYWDGKKNEYRPYEY